jgi:hypothetical protein
MESRFGHDFSRVRVHADERAADAAAAVNARAYTVGSQIVFAHGQYAPSLSEGRHLLAHELAHVVQQGRSQAMSPASEIAPADDQAEKEADRAAALVESSSTAVAPSLHAPASGLQRKPIEEDEIHKPLIEEYRREHGLPPGGVDESGKRVGPSDAEIKYSLLPAAGGSASAVPYCPSVEMLEGKLDFSDPKTRQAYVDANCLTTASQSMPPVCQFTPGQTKTLEEAQKTAGTRAERALGIINMSAEGKKMATEMASQLFENDPPTLAEVVDRLTKVRDFLKTAKIDFAGRTCGDSECQRGAVAYVTGPGALPIYVCPTAFSMPSSLHRTVLHEGLHWTGLDADPTTPEGYCSTFDCQTPCLDKTVADAWSHYLDCLGKPFTIRQDFRDKIIDSVKDLP